MSFSIDIRNLPHVRSYADALNTWERAIKVKDPDWRHLNSKRDSSKRIRLIHNVVSFRYHSTDVVKWHAQDHVEVTFWDSVSTGLFASCFLPPGIRVDKSDPMIVNGMRPQWSSINFRLVECEWRPDLDDVRVEYQVVADPKKVHAAQKRAREYLKYRRARWALEGRPEMFADDYVMFVRRHIGQLMEPPNAFPEVHRMLHAVSDTLILRAAAVNAGAVTKEPLPLGQRPTKSVYDPFF